MPAIIPKKIYPPRLRSKAWNKRHTVNPTIAQIVTLAKLFPPGAEAPNFDFGGGYGSSGAGSYSSSGGGQPSYGGAAPVTRVTRGADGVVYDPDQFDADANRRSR